MKREKEGKSKEIEATLRMLKELNEDSKKKASKRLKKVCNTFYNRREKYQ